MHDFKTYVRSNLPPLGLSGAQESEIVEELAIEFQEKYERALRNGATREEAWEEVTTAAGPWQELAEDLRSALRHRASTETVSPPAQKPANPFLRHMRDVRQDFRYARRQLGKSPGFVLVAVLTLALGIGANTAIFTLLNAVLLRNLTVSEPQQLVFFGNARAEGSTPYLANGRIFSYPFYREFKDRDQIYSDVAAIHSVMFGTHGRVDGPDLEKIDTELVSGTYFNTLGVHPVLGRLFADSDDRIAGAHPVAVASYSWWHRRFARDPSVVGRTVSINSTVYTIVGVAPPDFFGVTVDRSPDLWIPLAMQKEVSPAWNGLENKRFQTLHLIARLKPGMGADQAARGTTILYRQIAGDHAALDADERELDAIQRQQIELTPAATGRSTLRSQFSSPLLIVMVLVGLVLLIACANIANLLLARMCVRQREIAIRLALGAARARLIRQLLLECGLLALAGATVGVAFAWGAGSMLLAMVSTGSQSLPISIAPDATVLGFTLIITVLTVFVFGTAPAFFATRLDLAPSLKEGRGITSSPRRNRFAHGLIVGQVALSVVLLVGAGLFLRSMNNLMGVDTGFNRENVLVMGIDPAAAGYQPDASLESMMQRVEERVSSLPGVGSASFALYVFNAGSWRSGIDVLGRSESEDDPNVTYNIVGSQYFDAMTMPIVLGRGLNARDNTAARRAAVINETLARIYFSGASPLGRTLGVADNPDFQDIEVVGVVKDAKYLDLDEAPTPAAFFPHAQHPGGRFLYNFVVRHSVDSALLVSEIRSAIRELDPNLPVGDVTTLGRLVDDSMLDKRMVAQLSAFFGALAVFLACIGIYGVMSSAIARRTNEFGIRMALGAGRRQVLWVVLHETLVLAFLGLAIGLALAMASSRLIASLLFGLSANDPLTIGMALLVMVIVALFAGYLPARRATQIDPMVALRHE